jgi:hypothetical protein
MSAEHLAVVVPIDGQRHDGWYSRPIQRRGIAKLALRTWQCDCAVWRWFAKDPREVSGSVHPEMSIARCFVEWNG